MNARTEAAFESSLEETLFAGGYTPVAPAGYDRDRALFPAETLSFLQATQPEAWAKLEALHGSKTGERVLHDLASWLDTHGALATLRHGFKCYGRTLRLAYFPAAHGLNDALAARVAANRLGVTRQLRYGKSHGKSLDVVLSVNGLPVATIELKNPMTGQTAADAVRQYRDDRDPSDPLFAFGRRTLVHFAADPDAVQMTTRLAGQATVFLPFNKGRAGERGPHDVGAGNPPDPAGRDYRTAYLWEDVLTRESLLDLLARFLHVQTDERTTAEGRRIREETLIFPRYHQLRAVRTLAAAAAREGPGHNYLVEHSAGSGKSNTIAWLAHRLSSLHDANDRKVFAGVVVITDRRVLDRQLQSTVYQFEHRQGVVEKVETDAKQLARALAAGVPIVVTTLQKFPFVARHLADRAAESRGGERLPGLPYAVLVDEAHSSQSGDAAAELKEVLGGDALHDEARRRAEEDEALDLLDVYRSLARRGQQANLSFFAFTATPKHKTLAVFGRDGAPADRYTMRQAIEEGFILDVLRSYTTYGTYYRLLKATSDDPNVERKAAAKALARFMRLHPHNLAQKTEVMVEHFHAITRHRIGGQAKAMVVTGSRLEAVRYKQAFDRYIRARGYPVRTLVAFSGVVEDDAAPGKTYTEEGMNGGLKEKALPAAFATPEYHVLLVADKYQTGFDQPLLHTMYVDKRLDGIQAVQTLSRLNRTHPLKEDTFVLDFVNDRETIRAAFQQFYEGAVMGDEADPSQLYKLRADLDAADVYRSDEVDRFSAVFFKPRARQTAADHRALHTALDPAADRYRALEESDRAAAEQWRGRLQSFLSLYEFLSQVIPYGDSDLERLYTFLRELASRLPRRTTYAYEFGDRVQLAYYRVQKIAEGSISLADGEPAPLHGPTSVGTAALEPEPVPLSRLVDVLNERLGTDFTEADQLFFDQIVEAALQSGSLDAVARSNTFEKFQLVFRGALESLFIERMDLNEEMFARFMNEREFQRLIAEGLAEKVFERFNQRATSANERAVRDEFLFESDPIQASDQEMGFGHPG